jgi:ankyrin repeat protein/predicted Ser/Thr protein kinase
MSRDHMPEDLPRRPLDGLDADALLRAAADQPEDEDFFFDPGDESTFERIRRVLDAELADYHDFQALGRGGMGIVYRARHARLDRLVAIKVLLPTKVEPDEMRERFEREAKALAQLQHPNIVTVHDYGEAEGYPYLVMEFVDGASLRDILESGKFSPEEALALVPDVCDALSYAHEKGVVHRDIKPENILVDRDGRVKIADFGIAKIAEGPQPKRRLTKSRMVMGTPHYMAPEQAERPQEVDHRADIYSLGVVFYEMLTGELPVGVFQPPSKKVAVDVRLDEVVLRSLEKEPERRYQTAGEVKRGITRAGEKRDVPPLPVREAAAEEVEDATAPRGRSVASILLLVLGAGVLFFIVLCALVFFLFSARSVEPVPQGDGPTPVLPPLEESSSLDMRKDLEQTPREGRGGQGRRGPGRKRRATQDEAASGAAEDPVSSKRALEIVFVKAVRRGDLAAVRNALTLGVDPNARSPQGERALFLAFERGHQDVLDLLLEHPDIRLDTRGHFGRTFFFAVLKECQRDRKHVALAKRLIALDSRVVSEPSGPMQVMPLSLAMKLGVRDLVDLMLKSGAKFSPRANLASDLLVAARDHGEEFALLFVPQVPKDFEENVSRIPLPAGITSPRAQSISFLCVRYDRVAAALVEHSLAQGIDSQELHSALFTASGSGAVRTIKALHDGGVPLDLSTVSGETPLHLAVGGRRASAVQTLLSLGASRQAFSGSGFTPLMQAAAADDADMLTLLLEKATANDLALRNDEGLDVMGVAVAAGSVSATAVLKAKGMEIPVTAQVGEVVSRCREIEQKVGCEAPHGEWSEARLKLLELHATIEEKGAWPKRMIFNVKGERYDLRAPKPWIEALICYAAARQGQGDLVADKISFPIRFSEVGPYLIVRRDSGVPGEGFITFSHQLFVGQVAAAENPADILGTKVDITRRDRRGTKTTQHATWQF